LKFNVDVLKWSNWISHSLMRGTLVLGHGNSTSISILLRICVFLSPWNS
jgi:hypothetical protein